MMYVALLRGVNVGGKNTVSTASLRALFEKFGFTEVKSYINSGNIIFRTDKPRTELRKMIESGIAQELHVPITVMLRDEAQMKELVQALPDDWQNNTETKCDILFLDEAIDRPETVQQLPVQSELERVEYFPGAIGWLIDRKHVTKSRMFRLVGTSLYRQMTARNPSTVRKLAVLLGNAGI